jgi:uncharacterized repeat protein (TIGR01451 family)
MATTRRSALAAFSPSNQVSLPTSHVSENGMAVLRMVFIGAAMILSVAVQFGTARAQGGQRWAADQLVLPSAEEATRNLVALNAEYQLAGPAERGRLLQSLLDVAATRQQLLAALIDDEPQVVLRVAMPSDVRAGLSPEVQAFVEEDTEAEGEVEVLVEDRDTGSVTHYALKAQDGTRLSLHFAADPPKLLTGSRVRVRGVRVASALALESGNTSVQALSVALPNTFNAQPTLVILVNFLDKATQPYTVATAQSVVFTTTSNFDLENSFQQTWLTGDVVGWFTIPLNSTVCDSGSIASYAQSAATAAGVNLSAYRHYVYAFPQNACSWWGLGTVGGNPSQAWVNGSLALMVVGHEMGHNFGLYHSHGMDCGDSVIGDTCTITDYGDYLDIMGNSRPIHFNAFQKERLGWLNYNASPPITTVDTDGSYWLDPYESPSSNPKALKILKSTDPATGSNTWYYVEFRQAIGFDSSLSGFTNVLNGVVVHLGSDGNGNSSYLLDMTPADSFSTNPALDVGQSYYDPTAGVTITPLSASSSGALVNVAFGPISCVEANPAVVLSPSQSQWVKPGTIVTYTVTVTNNDNAGCSATTFALQGTVPASWTAAFASPTLAIAPGASASTTFQVASSPSAADGFYTVGVSATNSAGPAYTASASSTYVVASSLGVSVATDKPSYTRNQSVSIRASTSFNGSPVANASVTFTITRSNGTVVTLSATTGTNGTATVTLRLRKQDPTGTYQVRANASASGGVSGGATTSFTVQ